MQATLATCNVAYSKQFTQQRLIANLAAIAKQQDPSSFGRCCPRIIRCPDLGKAREVALMEQQDALETSLASERASHAEDLKGLQKRLDEARKELVQNEFKFMDAADAERALREQYEPELARLRAEVAGLDAARQAAASASKELVSSKRRFEELERRLAEAKDALQRQTVTSEKTAQSLRQALARRRGMLQDALQLEIIDGSVSESQVCSLRMIIEEIRAALRKEEEEASCRNCCCVCTDGPIEAVLLPCRHQQLCMTCAEALTLCPVCRASIESRLRVYM